MTEPKEAICQDCLRVRSFLSFEAAQDAECVSCGGDMCPCAGCTLTIVSLRAGERDWRRLGLSRAIAVWTAEDGLVEGPR